MLYIAENLRRLRKGKDLTQEEAAEALGISPQSVSKWERGDTFPDITLLPALANFYQVSVDALIGMDRINDARTKNTIFITGHNHLRNSDFEAAIGLYEDAIRMFPNDGGVMSDLAMALALDGVPANLHRAIALCERALSNSNSEKANHTTRAALCFIYLKAGEKEKAAAAAHLLPHERESRESVLAQLEKEPGVDDINSYLKLIAIGEE